jgi:DNA polymerase III epsilon subunit family exonuclease
MGAAVRAALDQGCGCFPTGGPWPGLIGDATTAVAGLVEGLDPRGDWARMPLVVLDVETTGLDPELDRVIELGLVLVDHGVVTAKTSWLVQPGIAVPKEALDVHGITDEQLQAAPPFAAIRDELLALTANRLPVAYNAPFDRAFLAAELGRTGGRPASFDESTEWIDPLVWARSLLPKEGGYKLSEITKRLEIELVDAHRAAADAEATAKVLLWLGPQMPATYVRLIRSQRDLAAAQSSDQAVWRGTGGPVSPLGREQK